jgi:tetratricopeptide (TPR) repeat protein
MKASNCRLSIRFAVLRTITVRLLPIFLLLTAPMVVSQEVAWSECLARGTQAYEQGNLEEAEIEFFSAISIAEKYFPKTPNHAISLFWLGSVYLQSNQSSKSESALEGSLEIMQMATIKDPESLSAIHESLGYAQMSQGKFREAKQNWDASLSHYSQLPSVRDMDIARKMQDICAEYQQAHSFEYAELCYDKARAHCITARGEVSECNSSLFNALGEVQAGLEQFDRSKFSFDKSIEIAQQIDAVFLEVIHLNNAGKSFSTLERYDVATIYLLKALALTGEQGFLENVPEDFGSEATRYTILLNLTNNEVQKENFGLAEEYLDESNVLCQSGEVDEDICQYSGIYFKTFVLKGMGREGEAFAAFREFITLQERIGFDAEYIKRFAFSIDKEFASQVFGPNTLPDEPQPDFYQSLNLESSRGVTPSPIDRNE